MRAQTAITLLDDVWQALEATGMRDSRNGDIGRGWITAVSTYATQLRILLRLPTELCRDQAELLTEVEDALRALTDVSDVELEVKPQPGDGAFARTDAPGAACRHESLVSEGLLEQRHQGWVVEGIRHRTAAPPAATAMEHAVTVRVLVRAWVAGQDGNSLGVTDIPRDA